MNVNFKPVQTNEMPLKEKVANIIWGWINCSLFRTTPPSLKSLNY